MWGWDRSVRVIDVHHTATVGGKALSPRTHLCSPFLQTMSACAFLRVVIWPCRTVLLLLTPSKVWPRDLPSPLLTYLLLTKSSSSSACVTSLLIDMTSVAGAKAMPHRQSTSASAVVSVDCSCQHSDKASLFQWPVGEGCCHSTSTAADFQRRWGRPDLWRGSWSSGGPLHLSRWAYPGQSLQ